MFKGSSFSQKLLFRVYLEEKIMGKDKNRNYVEPTTPSDMTNDTWYDLVPASVINGKKIHKACCRFRDVNKPNEYVMEGIPEGETEKESFILRFTEKGRVCPTPSKDQNP